MSHHFAVLAPPLAGHLNPLAVLARELGRRGHRLTYLHMPDAGRLVPPGAMAFEPVGADSYPTGALDAYLARLAKPTGPVGLLAMIRRTAGLTDMLCRETPEAIRRIGATAVIADQAEPAGGLVARHLGLPFVSTATALPLNREPGVPEPFLDWPYDPSPAGLRRNRAGARIAGLLMSGYRRRIARQARAWGLDPDENEGFSPLLQVAQCPRALDFPRERLPARFHYGGPWREPEAAGFESLGLPEDGVPLVFCSLGTLQGARVDLFAAVAQACVRRGVRLLLAHGGLLSGREAGTLAAMGPPGMVEVRAFVPQRAVLARSVAAVLHCGFNTVLDALAAGVPIVAMPIAFEQPATAARLLRTGAASVIPARKATPAAIEAALGSVLRNPAMAGASRRLARQMRDGRGVLKAADLIEKVLAGAAGTPLSGMAPP